MDLCAGPAPPPHHPEADPAEEQAFYRAGLRQLSAFALRLADRLEDAVHPDLAEQAETLERIARVFRRNALLARHLREPLRTTPPGARRGPAGPAGALRPLSELSDAELEVLEVESIEAERLDPLDSLENVGDRPIPDLIADSCRDLGLPPLAPYTPRPPGFAQPPEPPPPAVPRSASPPAASRHFGPPPPSLFPHDPAAPPTRPHPDTS